MKLLWNFHVTRTLTNIDFSIVIGGYLVYYNTVVSSNITLYILQGGFRYSCVGIGKHLISLTRSEIEVLWFSLKGVRNNSIITLGDVSSMTLDDDFLF